MKGATPVFFSIVIVASLLAMPAIAAGPATGNEAPDPDLQQVTVQENSPVTAENTTNRLPLGGDVRSERVEYGSDLGLALASADDQLRVDYEQYTIIDSEFATASVDERETMVRNAYNAITERTEALEEREREAVREHAAGERSDAELIQTLLRNQHEASVLAAALDELTQERTDDIPGYSLSYQQTRADETLLDLHQTSLRTSLDLASQSSDRKVDLVIRTSENGYSLSTIEGDMYVSETVRFDNRDADAPNQFENLSNAETIDRVTEHYPWAGSDQGWSEFHDSGEENLYITNMEVDRDQLKVYLDGGTGDVYREAQELSLESLPEADNRTWTDDWLELRLTETPADGPAAVTVAETRTDDPVTATITIDGTEIGQTDEDGTLWFVPPTDEYELTAETADRNVNGTVPATGD